MEDERAVAVDLDELRQVLLRLLDVDEGVARVVEDAEVAVDAHVDARGLEQRFVVGVDPDPTLREQPLDRPVGEDHDLDSKAVSRRGVICLWAFRWTTTIRPLIRASAGGSDGAARSGAGGSWRARSCSRLEPGSRSARAPSAAVRAMPLSPGSRRPPRTQ